MPWRPGKTAARGYGYRHQQERRRLRPIVEAGNAYCAQPHCLMPTRWIQPETPWDVGHNDDRTAYLGPCHRPCNQQAGASKGGRVTAGRNLQPKPWRPHGW